MTIITPGSGGSITATTLEAFFVAAVRRLQTLEKSTVYNPSNLNYITSSLSDDNSAFNATISFPLNYTVDGDGEISFTVVDYLTGTSSQYSAGSGGTITAANLPKAIFESALRISSLELLPAKNPTNLNCLAWTINKNETGSVYQGTFALTVTNFPLTIVDSGDSQTTKGKEYLVD